MKRPFSEAQMRERMKTTSCSVMRHYWRRLLNGLCANCDYPPVPGRRRCEVCEIKAQERTKKCRAKKAARVEVV